MPRSGAACSLTMPVQLPLSGETSVGRPAIENWFGGLMKSWEADPNKLVEVKVVNDKAIIYTGAWSGVLARR